MIDLYYWPTPNGNKITMMLEECGLDYTIHPINIGAGDQFQPDFLKLSPNNRMPAIVDHDPVGGGPRWTCLSRGLSYFISPRRRVNSIRRICVLGITL